MGAGINWWMGVKGRVCGKQRLTRVAVRGQAATRLEVLGLAPRQWRGPRMAAPGALAAALFAKQRARAEQDQRAAKKVEKQKADKSKRGKDVGNREKNKASGTARGRDDADSTLEQGKRSKGQSQAGAHQLPGNDASGGGSTSEDMNE